MGAPRVIRTPVRRAGPRRRAGRRAPARRSARASSSARCTAAVMPERDVEAARRRTGALRCWPVPEWCRGGGHGRRRARRARGRRPPRCRARPARRRSRRVHTRRRGSSSAVGEPRREQVGDERARVAVPPVVVFDRGDAGVLLDLHAARVPVELRQRRLAGCRSRGRTTTRPARRRGRRWRFATTVGRRLLEVLDGQNLAAVDQRGQVVVVAARGESCSCAVHRRGSPPPTRAIGFHSSRSACHCRTR